MKINPTVPLVDLKEPIKSTDFVLLEKIKNHRTAIGLKKADTRRDMPRIDEQGTVNKPLEGKQVQKENLAPLQWEWLKEVYKHAVLIDEINKLARRKVQWNDIELAIEQHAQQISDINMNEHSAANMATAQELARVLRKREVLADREWRLWINKIDHKRVINARELLELLMKSLGFKLGFIRQAWNQKHLTEIKTSLSKVALEHMHDAQLLHAVYQEKLDATKQVSTRISKNKFENEQMEKALQLTNWRSLEWESKSHENMILLLRAMGFNPGFIPLPAKQLELMEAAEKLSRLRVEMQQHKRIDLQEFREKLAELQSAALSAEGRQLILKQTDQRQTEHKDREINRLDNRSAKNARELYRMLLAAMGYKIGFLPLPWKRLELEEAKRQIDEATEKQLEPVADKSQSTEQNQSDNKEISANQKPSTPSREKSPMNELPPLKPKAFQDAYTPLGTKKVEFNEKDEEIARLKIEIEKKQEMGLVDFQLKLAQLQSAAQLAQTNAVASAAKTHESRDPGTPVDIRQKIKAAK